MTCLAILASASADADVFVYEVVITKDNVARPEESAPTIARSAEEAMRIRRYYFDTEIGLHHGYPRQIFSCKAGMWFATIRLRDYKTGEVDIAGGCRNESRKEAVKAAVQACLAKSTCGRLLRDPANGVGMMFSGFDDPAFDATRAFDEARAQERRTPGLRVTASEVPKLISCTKQLYRDAYDTKCRGVGFEDRRIDLLRSEQYWFTD